MFSNVPNRLGRQGRRQLAAEAGRMGLMGGLLALWPIAGGLLALNAPAAIRFSEVPAGLPNVAPGTVAWADYDNDGDLDITLTGTGVTAVWRNDGGYVFTLAGQGNPPFDIPFQYYGSFAWLDHDNDGDVEFLQAGHDGGVTYYGYVVQNNAAVMRQTYLLFFRAAFHPPAVSSTISPGDYDNDGVPEILITGQYFTTVYHFPRGVMSEVPSGLPDLQFPAAAWSDYDKDGDLDLILCGLGTNAHALTTLYRNQGGGVLANSGAAFPGVQTGSVAWGDFDNDADDDLLLTGQAEGLGPIARIYRNDGGAFTDLSAGLPGIEYSSAAWGDFDNDGQLDILVTGRRAGAPSTRLFRNLGNGSFTNVPVNLPPVDRSSVALGDFDNDGGLDVLLSGLTTSNTPISRLYRNTDGISNSQPSSPADLRASYTGGSLTLSWTAASDDEQAGGLTYNIRIGTLPGTGDVLSPASHPVTGRRFIPKPGNVGHRLAWTITNLTAGSYYATVQAIDHNYAASTFAPEVSVTPPVIADLPDRSMPLNTSTGPIPFTIGDHETAADELFVFGRSSDPDLVPPEALVFGGAGSNRTVTITPQPNRIGTATVTVSVIDSDAGTTSESFVLSVTNPPPTLSSLTDLVIPFNTISPAIPFRTGDLGTPVEELLLSVRSSNINLVPHEAIQLGGAGSNRTLTITPQPNRTGATAITVTVIDGHAGTTTAGFVLVVTNPLPTISDIANLLIPFNTTSPPLPFVIGDAETPAASLALSAHSSNTNLVPVGNIQFGGVGNDRTVTVTPQRNLAGAALITITVRDALGATNSDSFVLTVTNQAPTLSPVSDLAVYPGVPVPPVPVTVGDSETPASELVLTASGSGTNFLESVTTSGTGSNRVIQITPLAAAKGSSTITLVVSDPVGATATNRFTFRVGEFVPVATSLTNVQNGSVAWGDYDNDGDLDVLICGQSTGTSVTRLHSNNGDGTFAGVAAGLPGIVFGTVAWGDYDNDGRLDALLAGVPTVRVYRNLGGGAFTNLGLSVNAGQNSAAAAWGDYDNDGDLDFVVTGLGLPRLYRNNGDHTFTSLNAVFPAQQIWGSVAWGDYDNDGDLDLAFGVGGVFRNEGGGVFVDLKAGLPTFFQGTLAWGDYDEDGDLDLLTGQTGNASFPRLCRNNGDHTFTCLTNALPDLGPSGVAWGDYNQDGRLDLLLTGAANRDVLLLGAFAGVFRNQPDNTFEDIREALTGAASSAAAWGDFDGDGDLDALYCGAAKGPGTFLYRNQSPIPNSPPAAPASLTVLSNQVLAWDTANDPQSAAGAGLSYNLRIGSSPGAADILPPHADLATGVRRVAAAGNAGLARRWRADLPYGTYFWSVQTIDAAFVGSPFSLESSFTVTNLRPRLLAPSDHLTSINQPSPPLIVTVGDLETPAAGLVLRGTSSNPNLVPDQGLVFGGSASNRTVAVLPALNQTGRTMITLTATDAGGLSARASFVVTVTNYPPKISSIPGYSAAIARTTPPIPFSIGDAETPPEGLRVAGSSSNTNLVPNAGILFGGSGSNRFLTLTPALATTGACVITLTATDPYGASASSSFTVSFDLFTSVATNLIPATRGSLAWGDFDSDADLDLAIVGQNTSILDAQAVLYRNDAGVLVAGLTNAGNWVDASAAWGDLNNDGWLDFAISGRNSGINIFGNNGDSTFSGFGIGALIHSGSLAWGDAEGDGDLDLLATGGTGTFSAYASGIYLNQDFWAGYSASFTAVRQGSGTWADFDNDGDLDVLLTGLPLGTTNGLTRLYRNDGNLLFSDTGLSLPGLYNSAAAWADFNNDRWLDFVLCGFTGTSSFTRVYFNQRDGTFSESAPGLPDVQYGAVACGDADNDGYPDVLVCGLTDTTAASAITRLYRNNRDGTFTDLQAGLPGVYAGGAAFGDLDKDGDLDLAFCGSTATTFFSRLYRNNAIVPNTPPRTPSGISAVSVSNDVVTLSWPAAVDAESAQGLTYNLRVGRTPGGNEVVSSQSAADGTRRLPGLGNAGAARRRTLTLPPGTYYWAVQSVDAAYAGSPFTPEAILTLPDLQPRLSIGAPAGGQLEVRLAGEPNERYRLEVSSDLVLWSELLTTQASADGSVVLRVPLVSPGQRFFRARGAP